MIESEVEIRFDKVDLHYATLAPACTYSLSLDKKTRRVTEQTRKSI